MSSRAHLVIAVPLGVGAAMALLAAGCDREDVLGVKWSMDGPDGPLALSPHEPHRADIWFWKACRTPRCSGPTPTW